MQRLTPPTLVFGLDDYQQCKITLKLCWTLLVNLLVTLVYIKLKNWQQWKLVEEHMIKAPACFHMVLI